MDGNQWIAPAIILTFLGILANNVTAFFINKKKINADISLAEKKFQFDKDQLVHKRRFELAEGLLADAYHFRDLMGFVRNGATFGVEGTSRKPEQNEPENDKSMKDSYFVPVERLQKENDFISTFFAKQYTAQAQFGPEAVRAFELFSRSILEVRTASYMLIDGVGRHNNEKEFTNQLLCDIWERYALALKKEDLVGKKISEGVSTFEKLCKPVLEWKGA